MNRLFRRILLFCLMATLVLLPASAETFAGVDGALADAQAVILFTTDVHCGVSDGVGYAGVAGVRAALEEAGKDVLLVDVGDAIQGAPLGSLSEGEYVTRIMNELGYDAAVPGNHEFDYGMERFLELAENASFPYVAANFMSLETGESVFPAYVMLEAGGYQFAILGICTPKTITSSTPVYFQNDAGEFIYGFCQDDSGEALYACVQAAADEARAQGADYVVAAAHLGIDISCSPWTSSELIENTTGIDAVLDGHAHQVIEGEWVKNKDGEDVLLTSTGTKLERLGALCVGGDGALSAVSIAAVDEGMIDADMVEFIAGIEGELAEVTETVVATSEVDLVIEDPETGERIVRTAETNLGDLCADAYRAVTGADVAMVNGGGVRASIAAGEITYGDIISVHPFGNEVCPEFTPELFMRVTAKNVMKQKSFHKGMNQLVQEGAIQLYRNYQTDEYILGAVGQLQFEVFQFRMKNEYNSEVEMNSIGHRVARWIDPEQLDPRMSNTRNLLVKDRYGNPLFLFENEFAERFFHDKYPDVELTEKL